MTETPNMVWVSDITHVHDKDKLHSIGVIIDLYAQMGVAHKVSATADVAFIQVVFDAAFEMRGLPEGLISHSDQGLQYIHRLFSENISLSASSPFRTTVVTANMGSCWFVATAFRLRALFGLGLKQAILEVL